MYRYLRQDAPERKLLLTYLITARAILPARLHCTQTDNSNLLQDLRPAYILFANMRHKEESNISVVELHPTFAAEVRGVDFSREMPADVFEEIKKAIAKVF